MYISRIVYNGCCSFQDTNSQGSSLPSALFNLTQNYYYVIPHADEFFDISSNIEGTVEQITAEENEQLS